MLFTDKFELNAGHITKILKKRHKKDTEKLKIQPKTMKLVD